MSRSATDEAPDAPVACTLGSTELGTQVERWRKLYAEAGADRTVTDDGLRVGFRREAAVERELRELAAVEVRCCAWAGWAVEERGSELVLSVTSTGDGISVIHSWFLAEEPVLPRPDC